MYEFVIWGEDDTSDIMKTISGNEFSSFLELCFKNATFFSFNQALWANSTNKDLQIELEPFLIKEMFTPKWFGYDYSEAPPEDQRQVKVYLYKAESGAKNILLKYFSDIFLRTFRNGVLQDSLQTIEDLCFFSQESIFVGTVSHEYLLGVFPPNEEFEIFVKQLGDWKDTNQVPMLL